MNTIKYRSRLEKKVAKNLSKEWKYEQDRIRYFISKAYIPDFSKGNEHIEVKGYFRCGDIQKYKAINEEMRRQGQRFSFILQNPNKKVRKGAKLTMAGWCDKNNIPWEKA